MKKNPLLIITTALLSFQLTANAQPWFIAGNSNITTSNFLGTTNNQPLIVKTNDAERLRILGNGNVGIGTATPENKFHIFKGSAGSVTSWMDAPLVVENSANSYIQLLAPEANATGILFGKPSGNLSGGIFYNDISHNANGFDFRTNGNVTQMVLTNAGNVGVGTTSPGDKISIKGGAISFQHPNNDVPYVGIDYDPSSDAMRFRANLFSTALNTTLLTLNRVTGNLSIGTTLTPLARLYVRNPGRDNQDGKGIAVYSGGTGVSAFVDGGNFEGNVVGIYGWAQGGANIYGIVGETSIGDPTTDFRAAGYFSGDVYAASYNNISDRKFKTEITPLKNSLQQLMTLKPSSYLFKKTDYTKMGLPEGKQIGLMADEVKQVFPELVKQAVQPARYNEDRTDVLNPEVKYESVNYIGLIPVLIASIQEQQKEIEELKAIVKQLRGEKNIKTAINNVILEQNKPNPFNKSTIIRYSIPQGSKGQINIYDQTGKLVKALNANESGQTQLDGIGLTGGIYTYALVVNGKVAGSKQMVVGK